MTTAQDITTAQDVNDEEIQTRYFVDLNWYPEQGRSFAILAASRLCPISRKKEKSKAEAALMRTIKQCCSKREGFLSSNMPLLEMVFRIFLANGNQPLKLGQIQEQLQQLGDISGTRDLSIPRLKRILDNDQYYGLRPVPENEE
jgi:hypothetical protein